MQWPILTLKDAMEGDTYYMGEHQESNCKELLNFFALPN